MVSSLAKNILNNRNTLDVCSPYLCLLLERYHLQYWKHPHLRLPLTIPEAHLVLCSHYRLCQSMRKPCVNAHRLPSF